MLLRAAAFLLAGCAVLSAQQRGEATVATQGYYLGGNSRELTDVSGTAFGFRDFIPNFGLLSGNLEAYGNTGRLRSGDNFLELSGVRWGGRRWSFTGGDYRMPASVLDLPLTNIFYPEIAARGFKLESSNQTQGLVLFYGTETLLEGPRVPFRIAAPQRVFGARLQQKIGGRLRLGVRFLHLTRTGGNPDDEQLLLFRTGDFDRVDSLAFQSLYSLRKNLRLYAEAAVSATGEDRSSPNVRPAPGSLLAGATWETVRFTARANYTRQGVSYLPLAGYFQGDRQGPFGELRYRPVQRLEVFGSASQYRNNLERNGDLPSFRSVTTSAGISVSLPWKFSAIGQLSMVQFSSSVPYTAEVRDSRNRQINAVLARPIGRHTVRLTLRDLRLAANGRLENQKSWEAEDMTHFRRFSLGAAARVQRLAGPEPKTTVFFRGNAQAHFGRFTAAAYVENGNDLLNRTVFAVNSFDTIDLSVTAQLARAWDLQFETFRNRLTADLNPEYVFLVGSQGIGVSSSLFGFNQWSYYFRLSKRITWGGGLPRENLERYTAEQIPLVGEIVGFVGEQTLDGARRVEGIPVTLDQSRTALSGPDGRYQFSEVPEGIHRVSLARELPAEFDPGPAREAEVRVVPRRIARVDLNVIRLLSLPGVISTPESMAQADRENILIRLLPTDRYTTPDVEGQFAFYNLREGDYEVVVDEQSLPPNFVLSGPARIPVTLRHSFEPQPVHFEMKRRREEIPVRKIFEKPISVTPTER